MFPYTNVPFWVAYFAPQLFGHGSKTRTPSEHPNPHQNRFSNGWCTENPKMGSQNGFDNHSYMPRCHFGRSPCFAQLTKQSSQSLSDTAKKENNLFLGKAMWGGHQEKMGKEKNREQGATERPSPRKEMPPSSSREAPAEPGAQASKRLGPRALAPGTGGWRSRGPSRPAHRLPRSDF